MASDCLSRDQKASDDAKAKWMTEFLAAVKEPPDGSGKIYEIPDAEMNDITMVMPSTKPTLFLSPGSMHLEQASEQIVRVRSIDPEKEVGASPESKFFPSHKMSELEQAIEKIVCTRLIDLESRLEQMRPTPKPTLFLSPERTEMEQAIENIVCARLIDIENRLEHLHAVHMHKSETRHAELLDLLCGRMGSSAVTPKQLAQSLQQPLEDSSNAFVNAAAIPKSRLVNAGDRTKLDAEIDLNVLQRLRKLQATLDHLSDTVSVSTPVHKLQSKTTSSKTTSARQQQSSTSSCGRDYKPSPTGPGYQLRCRAGIEDVCSVESKEALMDKQIEFVNKIYARTTKRGRGVKIWRFFEDPNSSKMAKLYSRIVPLYIIITVLFSLLELISPGNVFNLDLSTKDALQIGLESVFMVELSLRFLSCPHPLVFWTQFYNISELLSCVAVIIRIIFRYAFSSANDAILAMSCIVPVLRFMKLIRHFEHFQLLFSAFKSAAEALPALLFTLLLITLTFAGLLFLVERDVAPTYTDALFFTIVTMSTVGYGNQVPETTLGMVIIGILIVISGLYLAIPIGIVGNAFSHVWAERGRLMILHRLRRFIVRAGFTFSDLQALFHMFDVNQDGSLALDEFSTMMEIMQVGMQQDWVMDVFETFDDDGDNCVDYEEFLKCLFPRAHKIAQRAFYSSCRSSPSRPSHDTDFRSSEEFDSFDVADIGDERPEQLRDGRLSRVSLVSLMSRQSSQSNFLSMATSEKIDKSLGPLRR